MLKALIDEYKALTLSAIDASDNLDFEKLNDILDKRQRCIEKIEALDNKEDIEDYIKTLELESLEKSLYENIIKKQEEIKNELKNITKFRQAGYAYNKKNITSSIFLNKKF